LRHQKRNEGFPAASVQLNDYVPIRASAEPGVEHLCLAGVEIIYAGGFRKRVKNVAGIFRARLRFTVP
jgi:hypothetical protein